MSLGVCTSDGCRREAKVKYECVKCNLPMKACSFHRQRLRRNMEAHLDEMHLQAVEKESAKHARDEEIAASPVLQAAERRKSVLVTVLVGVAVVVGLGLLTWLKVR